MNSLILYPYEKISDFKNSQVFEIKESARLNHLINILKVKLGQKLQVTLLNHGIGDAYVNYVDDKKIHLNLDLNNLTIPQKIPEIVAYIAISRPPTIKKILEHGTSLGITQFIFYQASLSEKSYRSSKVFEPQNIEHLLDLGLSQSAHYYKRPTVKILPYFPESEIKKNPHTFYLDPYGAPYAGLYNDDFLDINYERHQDNPYSFIIGPERGFTSAEIICLKNLGLKGIKIHSSILRVEIATFALLAILNLSCVQTSCRE